MSKIMNVATLQFAVSDDKKKNLEKARSLIEKAAASGAQLVVLPELFYLPYFPKVEDPKYRELAQTMEDCDVIKYMQEVAKEFAVMIVTSFYERSQQDYFNSLVLIGNEGAILKDIKGRDRYRKSHIPNNPGYCEEFYFKPGNTGFCVWETPIGNIGCGICWDQWYLESSRVLALLGADVICFPSAIGTEPAVKDLDTRYQWQLINRSGSLGNRLPVIAANRIGTEEDADTEVTFYGGSFATDGDGNIVQQAPFYDKGQTIEDSIIMTKIDIEANKTLQRDWRIFKRVPAHYGPICDNIHNQQYSAKL